MDLVGQQRQNASHQLGAEHSAHQRAADHRRDHWRHRRVMEKHLIDENQLYKVRSGQHDAAQQSHPGFLPHDLGQVGEPDLVERDAAGDLHRRLGAGVSAGVHQHRHIGHQHRAHRQGVFKVRDDLPRKRGRNHQQQKPDDAGTERLKNIGLKIGFVGRKHAGHFFDILRRLILQNIHGVVHGDDAHQPILLVHHRQSQKIILVQRLRHLLLIVQRGDGHDVLLHDVRQHGFLAGQQQRADGHEADQVPVFVDHIADVDGLLVRAGAADAAKGVRHGHVLFQIHELRGHDGPSGILRIFQNFIDALAHLRGRMLQNTFDHVGRHLLHDIHRVVQIQLVQHFPQLRVGKAADQKLLRIGIQLHEHLRRQLLGQQPEYRRHGRLRQLSQQGGNVRRLQFQKEAAQFRKSFSLYKILYFFQKFRPLVFKFKHTRILLS